VRAVNTIIETTAMRRDRAQFRGAHTLRGFDGPDDDDML